MAAVHLRSGMPRPLRPVAMRQEASVTDRASPELRGRARGCCARHLRAGAAEGFAGRRADARATATWSSYVRGARIQFFGEAGTEVSCGIVDAHREWHRNRLLLLQACQTTLLQRPARTLTQVKAGDATTTALNEPPRRTPTLVHRTSNGCTAADPLTGGGRRRSGKEAGGAVLARRSPVRHVPGAACRTNCRYEPVDDRSPVARSSCMAPETAG
jgi:hypothetical protein